MFTPASKKEAKLRLALVGASGAGKTWTALAIATAMGGKIALVDTEKMSASKYADHFKFDTVNFEPPFHPNRFIEAIQTAEALGYTTIILDSLSALWTGTGGIVSIVDDIATNSKSQSSFFAWNEGTSLYKQMVDAIVNSNIHVIGTMRVKQEYVLEKNEKGKVTPTRVGTKPIMRKDFEYEFDLVMSMDLQNCGTVIKTRCQDLPMGTKIPRPGAATARTLMTWLVGVEWIDAKSEPAIKYAAESWGIGKPEAWGRIDRAIKEEAVSGFLPKDEFKGWVELAKESAK
jgi:hypothetical protein